MSEEVKEEEKDVSKMSEEEFRNMIKEMIMRRAKETKPKESTMEKVKKILGIEFEPIKVKPEVSADYLSPLIQLEALRSLRDDKDDDEFLKDITKYVTVIKAIMGGNNEEVAALRQELAALREQMEKKEREEMMAMFTQKIDELNRSYGEKFAQIMEKFESIVSMIAERNQTPQKTPIDNLTEAINLINKLKESLSALGIKLVSPSEMPPTNLDPDQLKQYLEKMGYEVKPIKISKEELERMLKEQEERIRKQVETELKGKYDTAVVQAVENIFTEFLRSVGSKIAEIPVEEKRLKLAQQVQEVMQNVPQEQPPVGGGATTESSIQTF